MNSPEYFLENRKKGEKCMWFGECAPKLMCMIPENKTVGTCEPPEVLVREPAYVDEIPSGSASKKSSKNANYDVIHHEPAYLDELPPESA